MRQHNDPPEMKNKIFSLYSTSLFQSFYAQAIKTAYDEVIVFDSNRKIHVMNPSAEKNTGYSLTQAPSLTLDNLLSKEQQVFMRSVIAKANTGAIWQGELQFRTKNDVRETDEVTVSLVQIENNTLNYYVMIKRNVQDKKIHEMQLKYILEHDALTGLPNRRAFFDTLSNAIESAKKNETMLTVFYINIDKMKSINSLMGHQFGDHLIKAVAKRLVAEVSDQHFLSRMVSDEFTIIVQNIANADDVPNMASSIQRIFELPFQINRRNVQVTVSMGSSVFPLEGEDMDTICKNADDAMNIAKKDGYNQYRPFNTEIYIANVKRALLETRFKDAVMDRCDQFVPYFQPKVDTKTKKIVGSEALVRWITPDEGIIPPNSFIPMAEETGLIIPLSRYMLKESCRLNKLLIDEGIAIPVSVNIPPSVMLSADFINMAEEAISLSGMGSMYLDIEITEGMLLEDFEHANILIEKLHNMGITISIDDFGTGYSSLSYLSKIPVDRLKIDRSFVSGLPTLNDNIVLTQTIIMMTKSLKIISTAEGVETDSEYEYLKKMGCTEIQGYFVSKPQPFDEFLPFVRSWTATHTHERGGCK